MLVVLSKGLNKSDLNVLEFVSIEDVQHTAATADELSTQIMAMPLEFPSSAYEDGEFLWDYKDAAEFRFNTLSSVVNAVEGVEILEESEGPRYWFVKFTYKGETSGFGPGYKGE